MKTLVSFFAFFALLICPQLAFAGQMPPAFVGDWRGQWIDPPKGFLRGSPQITAQVIGLGNNEYEVVFLPEYERRAPVIFRGIGKEVNGVVRVSGEGMQCTVTSESITGSGLYKSKVPVSFELSKFTFVSPTMGRPAPDGAVVLFDGTSLDAWQHLQKEGPTKPIWRIVDGVLECVPQKDNKNLKGGDLISKQVFKSCELHLEFKLPYEPEKRGQGRANSGVDFQGTYEVQILDSYGLVGDWSECGALYKVAPPKVNRCAPPEQWQTYDIIYRAPEFSESGELVKNAVMTVRHNGKLIHHEQELFEVTHYLQKVRLLPPPTAPGPIELQDHGHPVQFRNIWLVELE